MRKLYILLSVVLLLTVISVYNTQKTKNIVTTKVNATLPATEKDCFPKQPETKQTAGQQAKIVATAKAMAQFNDEKHNTDDPQLQQLIEQYNEQVAAYDTCTTVTN